MYYLESKKKGKELNNVAGNGNAYIDGNSKQDTYEGYNLIDFSNFSTITRDGITLKKDKNDNFIANGTQTTSWIGLFSQSITSKLQNGQKYTIWAENFSEKPINDKSFYPQVVERNKTTGNQQYYFVHSNNVTFTADTENNNYTFIIQMGNKELTLSNSINRFMIYEGTDNKPYEPYVGGTSSPNPEYPQEIEVVDGCNMFDKDSVGIELGGYAGSTGGKYESTTRIRNTNSFLLKKGIYTISSQEATAIVINKVGGGKEIVSNTDSLTFVLNEEQNMLITIENPLLLESKIQITKGNTPKPYLPYGHIGLRQRGKNLVNIENYSKNEVLTINSMNNHEFEFTTYNNYAYEQTIFFKNIPLKKNTTYSIIRTKSSTIPSTMGALELYKNATWIKVVLSGTENSNTFTVDNDDIYILRIKLSNPNQTSYTGIISNIMISEFDGSYEPYHEPKTYAIDLAGNSIAKVGDVKDLLSISEKGVVELEKKNGRYVFTGDESFGLSGATTSSILSPVYGINRIAKEHKGMSSHFILNSYNTNIGSFDIYNNALSLRFCVDRSKFDDVIAFKTWLSTLYNAGTPVYVDYELAEPQKLTLPTTEPIKMWEGTNNFELITNLDTDYYVESHNSVNTNVKNRILSGKPIRAYLKFDAIEDKKELIINESNYLKNFDFSDERYVPGEGFLGQATAKEVTGNFYNVDSDFDVQDREFKLFVGVEMEDKTIEYIKYGTYIIQKPEKDTVTDNTTFTALDYMIKFNQEYIDRLSYPTTPRKILEDICDQAGVVCNVPKFLNEDFRVENNQFEKGTTLREVLKAICQIGFTWARINSEDELVMDFDKDAIIKETLDSNTYYKLTTQNQYGELNTVVLKLENAEGENATIRDDSSISKYGATEYSISNNPFAYTEAKRLQLVEKGKSLFGLKYIPIDIEDIGYIYLDCTDKIKVKDLNNKEYETYVLNRNFSYNGVINESTISSPAQTKTETKYQFTSADKQEQKHTELIVDKAKAEINAKVNKVETKVDTVTKTANTVAEDLGKLTLKVNDDIKDLQDQIDGNITTWFYETAPTLTNAPAKDWITTELKNMHLGDLYYDTKTGYAYRFMLKDGVYSWQKLSDSDIEKSLQIAQGARDIADNKRRVFYNTPVPPYDKGDLWVQGSDGDILRCNTAKTDKQTYAESDWVKASKYTDDTAVENLQIGGRNLLLETNQGAKRWTHHKANGTTSSRGEDIDGVKCFRTDISVISTSWQYTSYKIDELLPLLKENTEYVVSFDVKTNISTNLNVSIRRGDSTGSLTNYTPVDIIGVEKWQKVTIILKTLSDFSKIGVDSQVLYFTPFNKVGYYIIKNIKLEEGNKATDWSPAPEDIENSISTTVKSTDVEYYLSNSNTTLSGGSWQTTAPTWVDGKYMWSRTKTTLQNGTTSYSPSENGTCISGATGKSGTSITIKSTSVTYQASTSGTTTPTGTWSTTVPTVNKGEYLWTKTVVTYSDNKTTTAYSVAYKGTDGSNGKDGTNGINGTNGKNSYTHIRYSASADGTNFDTNPNGKGYIGIYYGELATAPTDKTKYTWSKYVGKDGTNGTNGKDGNGINSITYYYATSTTQTAPSTSSITSTTIPNLSATNKYLWQKEVIDFTDSSVADKTTVLLIAVYGDKGNTGATGTGIESITEEYYLSTSKTTQTGGSWVTTPPTWEYGKYIWTRSKIVYKNPSSTAYTTPVCSSEWEAVNEIQIGGRNLLLNSKGDVKAGFFKNFNINEEEELIVSLSSKKQYASINIAEGFIYGCRDYQVGKQVTWSYEIMYTEWDFPTGSNRQEFWMGQRYTSGSSGSSGEFTKVTGHSLPVVGIDGCELNKWYKVVKTLTIPNQASEEVGTEAKIKFYNSNEQVTAKFTARIRNVKLEYGNKATDWVPAIEDTNAQIDEIKTTAITKTSWESDIKINEESISQYVIKTRNDLITTDKRFDNYLTTEQTEQTLTNRFDEYSNEHERYFSFTENLIVNGVTEVDTKTGFKFNQEGLTIEKTDAKTKSILNEKGLDIKDATGSTNDDLLFAGYDENLGETIVKSKNMNVEKYLTIGLHSRMEDYTDSNGAGTGIFFI